MNPNSCPWLATAVLLLLMLSVSPAVVAEQPLDQQISDQHIAPRVFTFADGLPSERILSLAQTREGFMWIGTDRGLARFDGRIWAIFDRSTHATLGSDKISSLAPDRTGYLWVGTAGGGLYRFDGTNFLPVSRPNQLGGPWDVTALLQQNEGLLWVGTPQDLLFLSPGANSLRYGLPGIPVSDLAIDPYSHIWASAGRGLFRQVHQTFQTLSLPLGVESQNIHAVAMSADGLLMIGRDDGLLRARGEFENTGLPQVVESVEAGNGPVRRLLIAKAGHLIVGTDIGIGRLDGELYTPMVSLPQPSEGTTKLHSLLEDREGSLWIASSNGLLLSAKSGALPQPGITVAVLLDGQLHRGGASSYTVPPEVEELQFDISAPTFLRLEKLRLRARLDPHEDNWRDIDISLSYSDLPAGFYRLISEASLDGKTWTERRELEIRIEPHLHATVSFWLWIFGGLATIGAFGAGWIWYVRRRERFFAEMAAREWREMQEDSGMIDREDELFQNSNDPNWPPNE